MLFGKIYPRIFVIHPYKYFDLQLVAIRYDLCTLCKAISVQRNDTYPTIVREKSRAVINCKQTHSVHILNKRENATCELFVMYLQKETRLVIIQRCTFMLRTRLALKAGG